MDGRPRFRVIRWVSAVAVVLVEVIGLGLAFGARRPLALTWLSFRARRGSLEHWEELRRRDPELAVGLLGLQVTAIPERREAGVAGHDWVVVTFRGDGVSALSRQPGGLTTPVLVLSALEGEPERVIPTRGNYMMPSHRETALGVIEQEVPLSILTASGGRGGIGGNQFVHPTTGRMDPLSPVPPGDHEARIGFRVRASVFFDGLPAATANAPITVVSQPFVLELRK